MGIFRRCGGKSLLSQGHACRPATQLEEQRQPSLANHTLVCSAWFHMACLTLWEIDRLRQNDGLKKRAEMINGSPGKRSA
jgi:hypothetical protein